MIGFLGQLTAWITDNPRWLSSLAGAAVINAALLGLLSWGHVGSLPQLGTNPSNEPIELVFRARVPPPPNLGSEALAPEAITPRLPLRFRPKAPIHAFPTFGQERALPSPRLRLDLNPCDPNDLEKLRKPDCARPQDWLRADRDASEWLGASAQGMTLDEVAAARGWKKPKQAPVDRQSTMSAQTDYSARELNGLIFKDAPFPPDPGPQTAGP